MEEVREHGVVETKREAHFKSSQEKKLNVSGSFLQELYVEKRLEIW